MRLSLMVMSLGLALAWATVVPVSIAEYAFTPTPANVVQGDTVVWTNNGAFTHTSTSGVGGVPDGIWDSGLLGPGASYSRVFNDPGTFPYYCQPHYLSMSGSVVVSPATGFEQNGPDVVTTAHLVAVSPNPFRSATAIRFMPRGKGHVSLSILDAQGRVVRFLDAGLTSATWDGAGRDGHPVPAGVYLLRLDQGGSASYARLVKAR